MDIELDVGQVAIVNGERVRYMGNGRFEQVKPLPPQPEGEQLAKRFDAGGQIIGAGNAS